MERRIFLKSFASGVGLFAVPAKPSFTESGQCEHINVTIRNSDDYGMCYCPDCEKNIHVADAFRAMFEALRKRIEYIDRKRK